MASRRIVSPFAGIVPAAVPVILLAILLVAVPVVADGTGDGEEGWDGKRGTARFPELTWLVGEWQGYGVFPGRTTYIHKRYGHEVGGVFFTERTIDIFPPAERSTEFELHQDLTVFYRDTGTGGLKARGFFVEGFVTGCDVTASADGDTLVVASREVENGPPGMRSRIVYVRQGGDRFTAEFALAMPGRDFQNLETLVMDRVH